MRPKAYRVLSDAVELGVNYGWNRAHKHTDAPGEDVIREEIRQAILNEICEAFHFDDAEITPALGTCSGCAFFLPPSDNGPGNCRRRPPIHDVWPLVRTQDWCGEFAAKAGA